MTLTLGIKHSAKREQSFEELRRIKDRQTKNHEKGHYDFKYKIFESLY